MDVFILLIIIYTLLQCLVVELIDFGFEWVKGME